MSKGSFGGLSEAELESHMSVLRYGRFTLTGAIRPSPDLKVVPRQGYRHDAYVDEDGRVPVLMAAASREHLFDVFLELIDPLGPEVDVVLETSHYRDAPTHADLYRESIDLTVLKSILWDYEDLLVNDGCTGIAVVNGSISQEVLFEEHKLLIVYGEPLAAFEAVFRRFDVACDEEMKFLTEAEHVHASSEAFAQRFRDLSLALGAESALD